MTIYGLSSIANQAVRVAAAPVRPETAAPLSPADSSASTPAAIYHRSQNDDASGLSEPGDIKVYGSYPKIDPHDIQMQVEALNLWIHGLPDASAGLRNSYDTATAALSPELLQKDWGFSVSNGQLVVLEGSDPLSDQELTTLRQVLTELTPAANVVAETTVRMIELDRGTNGVSNGIGRFDVSTQNFADVVDLRKYLLTHGPSGKYNQARDPSDLRSVYGTGGWAIMDQIEVNAEARFTVPKLSF